MIKMPLRVKGIFVILPNPKSVPWLSRGSILSEAEQRTGKNQMNLTVKEENDFSPLMI